MRPDIVTISDLLFWAYANLAMAHAAVTDNTDRYDSKHYGIRKRLFHGLQNNTMDIRSFFDDERLKMILPQSCCYCGLTDNLAADHIIPRKAGGQDIGENLIWSCRSCNSSKSARDMLEWMQSKGTFPSILLYRRYLKILITYCRDNGLLGTKLNDTQVDRLPFNLSAIPLDELPLNKMRLWVGSIYYGSRPEYMPPRKSRIANWNLERPLKHTEKLELAVQKIKEINPDICILTETSRLANLGSEYYVAQCDEYNDMPNEQWAAIWSKWPIEKTIKTFDTHRATCCLIGAPFGPIIVYATIIPYHNAGVIDYGKYSYAEKRYAPWQMHKEDLVLQGADWLKISRDYQGVPLCVAGDFNQTRDGLRGGYGTDEARGLLAQILDICELSCITEEGFGGNGKLSSDPKKGYPRRNVDHICISRNWERSLDKIEIGAWDHFTDKGKYMTDHNGVYFDFTV